MNLYELPFLFGVIGGTVDPNTVLIWGGGGLAVLLFIVAILRSIIVLCPPNCLMVVSGRGGKEAKGRQGYRHYLGGRTFRIPLLERVDYMDLTTIPINISIRNSYSKGGIALDVQAVANVKIASEPKVIKNAIERFLGRDRDDILRAAKDTLEGNLREILATMTPEDVNEDRLEFANRIRKFAGEDLAKLGLHLDILKVQHVTDNSKYLDSIGRQQIAKIIRDAEIAESDAKREAENVAAKAKADAHVAKETAEAEIAKERNSLRELVAELEAKAKAEEEKTMAAAREARAIAEQELQEIRAELEKLRLQADKVIPAEALKQARELQAKGKAAPIAENGRALAEALSNISDAWTSAGDQARDIFVIQQLEKLLTMIVETVNDMKIHEVNLIDNGDGQAIPNYVKSFPATVAAIMRSLRESTGIDLTEVLSSTIHGKEKE